MKNQNDIIKEIDIDNATRDTRHLNVLVEKDINSLIDKVDLNASFEPKVELKENLQAPILQGDILGTVTYEIEGVTYTANLIAGHDVFESHLLLYISLSGFIIFIGFGFLCFRKNKLKKKNYRMK